MMCCNECPFHPVLGTVKEVCSRPVCRSTGKRCSDGFCAANIGSRCPLDHYVIEKLYQNDELAVKLAPFTLRTALTGRDRALLLSLFHSAGEPMRIRFWRWLQVYEPRSLWLLNPVFTAAGLAPLNSFGGTGPCRSKYLSAIISNPYGGRMLSPCRLQMV